ncbi:ammonium transporter [Acrasis kona]|uniref:Ammonium transporter n=1 Tax=Acrasis kona TaxID=1008807 RepID=A0AAW2Z081_9EUKA
MQPQTADVPGTTSIDKSSAPRESVDTISRKEKIKDAWNKIKWESWTFAIVLGLCECVFLALYCSVVTYGESDFAASKGGLDDVTFYYKAYSDIAIMMFIGFGLLMTFLKKASYTSVCMSFLIICICTQWAILVVAFWEYVAANHFHKIPLNVYWLVQGMFGSATVLISFGAVIGKISPVQLVIMAVVEIFFYGLNIYVGDFILKSTDIGGSMFIHTFGAYFGLCVSAFISNKKSKHGHVNKTPQYLNDIFSMIGTIFLWVYWPSFNSAPATITTRQQTIINTTLAQVGCTITTYIMSRLLRHGMKFEMEDLQNAAVSGGVAVGATANIMIQPGGALGIGLISGIISVLGFRFLTPFLEKRLRLHDSCGIHNLHGMPGVLGAIASIVATGIYSVNDPSLFKQGRAQAGFQAAALGVTLGIAIISGCITGLILMGLFPVRTQFFDDDKFFCLPVELMDEKNRAEEGLVGVYPPDANITSVELQDIKTLSDRGVTRAAAADIM